MRKLITLFIAVAFAAGTAGFAVAQQTEQKMDEKKDMKAGEMKSDKKMAAKTARGTVKSASADSIVVAGKEKGKEAEWTFGVDSKTSIKKGGKAITAGDLKAGDSVQVKFMDHEGKMMAQSVMVRGAGTAKKMEEKK